MLQLWGLVPGNYTVFIQMVGKSHILNRTSPAVLLSMGGVTSPGQLPTARMTPPSPEPTDVPMEKPEPASNASATDGAAVATHERANISVVSPAEGSHVSIP